MDHLNQDNKRKLNDMDHLNKENIKKRKLNDHDDAGAMTVLDRNQISPTNCLSTDLIDGLPRDVVLGEVLPRLPWYNLPSLKAINRSWAYAMTDSDSFPSYSHLHHRRALSKSIILSGIPYTSTSNLRLWVCSITNGIILRLPIPNISATLLRDAEYVCDDNEECIYSFTPVNENGQNVYTVDIIDVREGNSQWKRLPSLPFSEERYVYRCNSSGNYRASDYIIWMQRSTEPRAFSVWTLNARNNSNLQWEERDVGSPLIHNLTTKFEAEKQLPMYVEMNVPILGLRYFYMRWEQRAYEAELSTEGYTAPWFMFMDRDQKDHGEDSHSEGQFCAYNLYHMTSFDSDTGSCEVILHEAMVDEKTTKIVGESDLEFWLINFFGGEKGSVLQVFPRKEAEASIDVVEWEEDLIEADCESFAFPCEESRMRFKLDKHVGEKDEDYIGESLLNMKVAQQVSSLYVYRLLMVTRTRERDAVA